MGLKPRTESTGVSALCARGERRAAPPALRSRRLRGLRAPASPTEMGQMRDGVSLFTSTIRVQTSEFRQLEGNLPGLHKTYLHVKSELAGALLVVKLGPVTLLLVRLRTGTQKLLVKLVQLYLAGSYHQLALTCPPSIQVAFGR